MSYQDYPHTFAVLRKHLPSIASVRPSHGGALVVINTVRHEVGLAPLNIDDMILASLGRIEDKLNAQATETGPESGDEPQDT